MAYGRGGNPKIKKYIDMLGRIPDKEFAELVGCHPQYPYFLRRKRGMLCTRPHCITSVDWEAYSVLFGVQEDAAIANALDCSLAAVQRERQRRGIKPFYKDRTCVCGATFTPKHGNRRHCSNTCEANFSHHRRHSETLEEAQQKMREYGARKREED
jgi:hypothetical protein